MHQADDQPGGRLAIPIDSKSDSLTSSELHELTVVLASSQPGKLPLV